MFPMWISGQHLFILNSYPWKLFHRDQKNPIINQRWFLFVLFILLLNLSNYNFNIVKVKGDHQVDLTTIKYIENELESNKIKQWNDLLLSQSNLRNVTHQIHRRRRKRWLPFGPGGVVKVKRILLIFYLSSMQKKNSISFCRLFWVSVFPSIFPIRIVP